MAETAHLVGRVTHGNVWLTGLHAYGGPPRALFIVRTYQPTSQPINRHGLRTGRSYVEAVAHGR